MATFGYCRVSTAKQAAEGESLDVQRRQIEGYALMHGLVRATLRPCRREAIESAMRA
jgi:DNA invertase Pin-like site-specific DNA recombinase